jgi:hypothetical protein
MLIPKGCYYYRTCLSIVFEPWKGAIIVLQANNVTLSGLK